jgi:hypothetical protein
MLYTLLLPIFYRKCVTLFVNSLLVLCRFFFVRQQCTSCDRELRIMPAVQIVCFIPFFLWRCSPALAMASSFLRILDHTQRHTTVGRTPLGEWSAHRRDLYLTTHNTIQPHNISRRTAADLRLKPLGYWNLFVVPLCVELIALIRSSVSVAKYEEYYNLHILHYSISDYYHFCFSAWRLGVLILLL